MKKYPIQNALKFLHELHNSYIEMEDEQLLERCDCSKIKAAISIPDAKWNSKILYSGWEIIVKYQEILVDNGYTVDCIEKPDFETTVCNRTGSNIMIYDDNKIIIKNISECVREQFSISCSEHDLILDLNLSNLYKIIGSIVSGVIALDKECLKKINIFLNDLTEDNMFCGLGYEFKQKLKPFQEVGTLFMLMNKKVLLGDEMGLGKSLQAITTVDIADAYPCLIVCPSSLKYNWQDEIGKATDRSVQFLNNINPTDKHFYIINYESLHKHMPFLKELGLKSIIFDESHYLKNGDAKRTKNCLNVVKNIEYRIELSGTAVLKTPIDLVSQLTVLNRIESFGGKDKFLEKYCKPSKTTFGTDYSGASNLNDLALELRESCFIRRTKKEVLSELPEKIRTKVMVDVPNLTEYKRTLKDFLNLDKKCKIKKIEEFRQAVAEFKLVMIKEIIDDFLANNQKIVVFAYHKNIQNKLIEMYPDACRIISEDSALQDFNKKSFQDDDSKRIIICSFRIANMGVDLTAASNVILTEMDWCPAINNQAEDRCHRIGQHSSVNAWYIIAKDTIEEHIWNICERKREIIEKIYAKDYTHDDISKLYDSIIEEVIDLLED